MPDRATPTATNQITELKVSGHMMALDPGLYCVFNAPDGPSPSAETGLPGVRITASPGRREGQVSVSGFHADGWIGADSAALVRVTGSAAEVLVTVYQSPDSTADAPKLQVVRLSGGGAASAAQPAGASARQSAAPATVEVVAHIYARGDVGGRLGDWMGEPGSNRWIEGFGVAPADGVPLSDIEYQAVLGRGWLSPWSEGGQFCGSRGMSLPILGLRVRLRGASAETHQVTLSATFVDGTRIGPVAGGDPCEAPSLAALEAFQVVIEPKSTRAAKPARGRAAAIEAAPAAPPKKPAAKAATLKAPAPQPAPKPAPKAASKPAPKAVEAPPPPAPEPKAPAKPTSRAAARKPATTRRR